MADSRIDPEIQIVFAGKVDAGAEHYLTETRERIERLGLTSRMHWAGHLDAGELSWCFNNSRLFVMTSRAEACPNTVLEALSHGCLSVSGDNDPMPEFFGDCAIYYRNGDGSSAADAIVQALSLPAPHEKVLRERAVRRSYDYTWDECARRTVDELERAVIRQSQ